MTNCFRRYYAKNTLQQISIYGRLLGAVFYYEPNDARLTDILTFFRQPNWMQEWEISFDVKTYKKITALIEKRAATKYH